MDRVLIGPFEITTVSQYLWAKMGGRARAMDWTLRNLLVGVLI